jgi:hypothetical protein
MVKFPAEEREELETISLFPEEFELVLSNEASRLVPRKILPTEEEFVPAMSTLDVVVVLPLISRIPPPRRLPELVTKICPLKAMKIPD